MKLTKKKVAVAKSEANTERNRRKAQRRFTQNNKPRAANGTVMLGFVPGAPLVPVLDLLNLGGPERVHACIRHHVPGGLQQRAVEFHNKVAAAFKAAGL